MLSRKSIDANLAELEVLFDNSKKTSEQVYFSKIALIEACGWIEQCIKHIASEYYANNLGEEHKAGFTKFIADVHGFTYKNHVRKILVQLVGMLNFIKIENNLKQNGISHSVLNSILKSLSESRNPAAHTHVDGMQTFDAPSKVKHDFEQVYSALAELESQLRLIQ